MELIIHNHENPEIGPGQAKAKSQISQNSLVMAMVPGCCILHGSGENQDKLVGFIKNVWLIEQASGSEFRGGRGWIILMESCVYIFMSS